MTKLKIFISAYACEPGLGSEIGVGWQQLGAGNVEVLRIVGIDTP